MICLIPDKLFPPVYGIYYDYLTYFLGRFIHELNLVRIFFNFTRWIKLNERGNLYS